MEQVSSGQDGESDHERLTRNVSELLGELRVAQAGVQILFGFLLAVVFTASFREANGFEKALHMTAVLLAVLATALLSAPAAWHRMLFREGRRREILRLGNKFVLCGLVCLALAVTVTVALIAKVVFGPVAMIAMGLGVGVVFGVVWFLAPMRMR